MAMSPEAGPQGEQPIDPVQEARRAFNRGLLGREYQPGILLTSTLQLQNVLLQSSLSPEKIYDELTLIAGQGVDRAEVFEDEGTASTLKELQRGFQLTYETFSPRMQVTEALQPAQPTRTESLPPMTSAKGGDRPLQTQRRPAQAVATSTASVSSPAPTSAPGEAPTTGLSGDVPEETFSSFLREKRMRAGLSQGKLGSAAGDLPQSLIGSIERGALPDETKVNQLISALGLNEEDTKKILDLYNKQKQKNSPEAPKK